MRHLAHAVDVEGWNLDLLFHQIVVDAHDGTLVSVNLLLIAISRLGDLALEEAVLDAGQHTTQRIDAVDIVHRRLFGLVGQGLDEVRTTQGIDRVDHAALRGNDLLRAQGEQGSLLGGQRQGFVERIGMQRVGAAKHRGQGLQ